MRDYCAALALSARCGAQQGSQVKMMVR